MDLEEYLEAVKACLAGDSQEGLEALGIHDNLSILVNAPYETVLGWFNASENFRPPRATKANALRGAFYERRKSAIDVKINEGVIRSNLTCYGVEAGDPDGHILRQKESFNVALMICIRYEVLVKENRYMDRIARGLVEIGEGLVLGKQIPACLPDSKPEVVYYCPKPGLSRKSV